MYINEYYIYIIYKELKNRRKRNNLNTILWIYPCNKFQKKENKKRENKEKSLN